MRWQEIIEDRETLSYKGSLTFYAGGARCRLTPEDGVLYMSHVVTRDEDRGQGHATRAIQKALAYADQQGKAVTLVAMPDDDEDVDRLIAFYQRFGFQPDKPHPGCQMMTRPAEQTG